MTCIFISSPRAVKRSRTAAGSTVQRFRLTSMIMQNISCMMDWEMSSMLMFSSAQTALTLATTPTVSCPMTVITAFIRFAPSFRMIVL